MANLIEIVFLRVTHDLFLSLVSYQFALTLVGHGHTHAFKYGTIELLGDFPHYHDLSLFREVGANN